MRISVLSHRLDFHIVWTLAKREWFNGLRSPSIYLISTLAAIVQVVILSYPLGYFSDYRLFISSDPLVPAFLGAVAVISTYAAITASLSLIQERENRTLRVLFYTPVDHNSLILGKYLAQILNSLVVILLASLFLVASAILTNFSLSVQLIWAIVLCILLVSAMVAFGLTLSAYSRSVRNTIFLLFVLLLFFFGLQIAERIVDQILPVRGSNMLIFFSPLLDALTVILSFFSPLTYLLRGLEAAALASVSDYLINLIASFFYTIIFLTLATWISRRRGMKSMRLRNVLLFFVAVVTLIVASYLIIRRRGIISGQQASSQGAQLVFDVWAQTGQRYNNIFYPQSEDTIFMISDVDNVIAPKLTEVYYWPLTFEYKADWSTLDEDLTGIIEVKQDGDTVTMLKRTPYSLVYSEIIPKEVVFGDEAEESYLQYQAESKRIAEDIDAYYEAMIEYQIEYEKYIDEIKKGNLDAVRPEQPVDEQPVLKQYVSRPSSAYHVNLTAGEYEIQLITSDGKAVEGSQKKLRVFSPRQEGAGYKAFIPERWTIPETGADPEDTFYVQPDTILYFQPYYAQEFNRFDYSKLLSPQKESTGKNAWQWVLTGAIDDVELQLSAQGKTIDTMILDQFIVEQIPGSKLGYDIIPFVEDTVEEREPTFSALRVTPPKEGDTYQIQMVNSEGEVLDGSDREIRIITRTNASILYLIAAIPLFLGAITFGWRRYQIVREYLPGSSEEDVK